MANSSAPVSFALATVAVSGTSVAPSATIPDNCRTIIIFNRGTGAALFGRAAPGAGTLTEGTNAARIPDQGSISLEVGTLATRGSMVEATIAGSGLVYDGVGGTTPVLDITYINVLSPQGG